MKARVFAFSLVACLLSASRGWAYLIHSVSVLPVVPTPATPVGLSMWMTTPGSPPILSQPTTMARNGNHFSVDVYLDSGFLTALGSISETAPLGNLAIGTYDYTVTLHPSMDIPLGRDMRVVNGSFTVVPEPSTLLLASGLAVTLMPRRARRGV